MILLDTNVVSEPLRPAPDTRVIEWMDGQSLETLFLSAVTVAELRAGGPYLLAGDDPLVAVAHGLCLQAGKVAAGAGFAEQLAADEFGPVHPLQVQVFRHVAAVGEDGGRHHPEADGECALVGHLVLRLEAVPEAFVGVR